MSDPGHDPSAGTPDDADPDDELDDRTVRISRTAAPDDATHVARRRGGDGGAQTQPSEAGDASAEPGPRRTSADPTAEDPDDGSTMVARRESRRRASRDVSGPLAATSAADVPSSIGRIARSPEEPLPSYGPRSADPARIARSAPEPTSPQTPVDTAGVDAAARRRARRRAVIALVAASVLVAAVVAALIALTAVTG
ncbi:hypothetical protein ABZ477_08425 [Microbacterium sp. NPDC019599]|uniref:hypothetical protein n=1 Tax=Microbacterium sp. NPDC019599 TaxID=3154690 RepID=UPI00340315B8